MYMRNVCIKALTLALAVIGFLATTPRSEAQLVQTLMQFTNQWRYLQTGTEQGTAWRAISFPAESTWPQGRGILGFETDAIAAYAVHAPTLTPLTISQSITTYYFRTTFNFSGSTNGVTLIATNLVDDGCAIYLNGVLAANPLRLPASYNAASLATGGPATEGVLEPLTLNGLRTGANTIAVEVHQSSATSSDVMFGIKLVSISPQTLLITNQPQSQTVSAGDPVTFSVGVSGGPAFYRWQKDGVNLSSTSNTLTIANPQLANAGSYRVFVTNILSSLVSDIAVLTVTADSDGRYRMEKVRLPIQKTEFNADHDKTGKFLIKVILLCVNPPCCSVFSAWAK